MDPRVDDRQHFIPPTQAAGIPNRPTELGSNTRFMDRRPLSRSGISYNGSPSGITIDMFLFQLDTISTTMCSPDEVILSELHTLLKDVALQWYWTYRKHNPNSCWTSLRADMIERFRDRRTDYEIRRMVESRKQQSNESFLDFYNQIWTLTLQCRTPYRDEELIQILMNNMKPTLQYHLTDRQFSSINALIKSCMAWEESLKRFRTTDPPTYSRRAINELSGEPYDSVRSVEEGPDQYLPSNPAESGNYTHTGRPNEDTRKRDGNTTNEQSEKIHEIRRDHTNVVCYNCSDLGHTFIECRLAPMGLFCYKCGLKGTITPRCSRCIDNRRRLQSRSENQDSGSWRTGRPGPSTIPPRPIKEEAASNIDPEFRRQTGGIPPKKI